MRLHRVCNMIVFFSCSISYSFAQDCSGALPFKKGAKIEYAMVDKKEKPTGTLQYLVNDVTINGGGLTANITSSMSDEKGKQLSTSNFTYSCTGNDLVIDMKSMLSDQMMSAYKDMTIKATSGSMTIPYGAKVGETLPDASMHMDILNEDKTFATIDINITNQKVEAKEDVTTPAGTFSCVRVSYDSEMKTKTMGIGVPVNSHAVTWYSPKVGMVKNESFSKDGKLMGRMLLNSFSE